MRSTSLGLQTLRLPKTGCVYSGLFPGVYVAAARSCVVCGLCFALQPGTCVMTQHGCQQCVCTPQLAACVCVEAVARPPLESIHCCFCLYTHPYENSIVGLLFYTTSMMLLQQLLWPPCTASAMLLLHFCTVPCLSRTSSAVVPATASLT